MHYFGVNRTLGRALLGLAIIGPFTWWSVRRAFRSPGVGTRLQALGATGLLAVIGAHLCEAFGWLPLMGWGRPNTVGHYVDLAGAALGLTLAPLGYLLSRHPKA